MFNKLKYILKQNRCYCEINISETKLQEMINKGALLLDVRSLQEFEEGHLKNAILLPVYEIKEKAENVLQNKEQLIIVYCSTGNRSQKAQKLLLKLGYKRVYNLCNGLENCK